MLPCKALGLFCGLSFWLILLPRLTSAAMSSKPTQNQIGYHGTMFLGFPSIRPAPAALLISPASRLVPADTGCSTHWVQS
jgi:hypothetical protein